ncbi:protein angel homolog 2 [Myripristis murdjan]|uniref:Angel homolog 2 (Drosophila) n=1 Tax=Myripristis murdjan TaxID=586833 RepID=A0A667YRQ5_9TELE|nr:protein angel homolog 2 [Myripristis murdjan]XP_029903606.1 protein angel homolog 2 [Myripristis murdjan]
MLVRQLSSSFLPVSRPALLRAGFRSTSAASSSSSSSSCWHLPLTPHPCWSVRRFPPWPPHRLPASSQPTRRLLSGRTVQNLNLPPADFSGSWRRFHASAGLMEHRDRDRGPPHKRWKSTEEKRSIVETEGCRGGGASAGANQGDPRREQQQQHDAATTPNHWSKKTRKAREGERGVSRDKDRERSGSGSRGAPPKLKDSGGRDGTPDGGRSVQEPAGRKESPPAGQSHSPKTPKPPDVNPWFKGRAPQEQGGPGTEPRPRAPNPWVTAGAWRQPAPPAGGSLPLRAQWPLKTSRPLRRRWEASPSCSADLQPPGVSAAFDFSVLSYNILSQELLQDNAYLYRHCDPAVLPWDYRLPHLLAEIQHYNADIVCLQEVQENHYETQIKPALEALGYQCEYKKRTGKKPDGCAIVFKTSRLSLVSSNPVEFFRPGDALLDRDNVGLVLMLRPDAAAAAGRAEPSALVCVANTHLLYNPRRGDVKLAQLAILLAEINRLSRLPDGSANPVVMCGDFNSTPWSPLYSFLTTGCLQYRGLPIGQVSGQESSPRGQRVLTAPIWSSKLGIDQRCQYESSRGTEAPSGRSTGVEVAISDLTVEELATKPAAALHSPRIEHSVKLQSSYQHLLMHDGRPEITTCHSRTAMTVDYILYTPDSPTSSSLPGGRGLELLGRLSLVGMSELEEVNGLPNQHHSSDHLPLLARFRLQR